MRELIGGEEAALRELIETFIDEGDEIVIQLRDAIETRNIESLRRGAHSLKSSAQDFGASGLSQLCAMLESRCRQGWPGDTVEQVALIETAFSTTRTDLERYLQEPSD